MKYLGIPLSPRKWSSVKCHALLEKITKRIYTWTTRHLFYARRVQLINPVLFTLDTYWSSLFILPKKIIKQIEAICRNFLWSQSTNYHKTPQVTWDTICKPKAQGGLGIHNFHLWNIAVIGKHVWFSPEGKQSLWVK